MAKNVLEVIALHKAFDNANIKALQDVNLQIAAGSFVSLIGPNGAGKSTLINIICTLLKPSQGSVKIDGVDIAENPILARKNIGIVFQESVLDSDLTVYENLYLRAHLYDLTTTEIQSRLTNLTELVDIADLMNRQYGQLSGGQKRRVDIVRGLLNFPKLLILDEPTTGLDPKTRFLVWEMIKTLQIKLNIAVLLTTHYMEETLNSDKVIVINQGKLITEGTPDDLKSKYSQTKVKLYYLKTHKSALIVKLSAIGITPEISDESIHFFIKNVSILYDLLNDIRAHISDFEVIRGNMDNVYMHIIENHNQLS